VSADPTLAALLTELRGYPAVKKKPIRNSAAWSCRSNYAPSRSALHVHDDDHVRHAVEVTLSELMLEAFYPADEFTGMCCARGRTRR